MSKLKPPHDPIEAMGEAYELLLESAARDYKSARDAGSEGFYNFIEKAEKGAVELGHLTAEEAGLAREAITRDLRDAAHYLSEGSKDLADWLGFETALVENRFLELFRKAADQTVLEHLRLKDEASQYRTGEMTGMGTLRCKACGELLHFHGPGHIPPCPQCRETEFVRVSE